MVSAAGIGFSALETALRNGTEGLSFNTLWESSLTKQFPVGKVQAELTAPDGVRLRQGFDAQSRSGQLALIASAEALSMANVNADGVFLGQSVCGTRSSEEAYIALKGNPQADLRPMLLHDSSQIIDVLSEAFGLRGPSMSVLTACSSAANAIGMAADEIRLGRADVMLAGGADSLSKIAFNGFCSLKVVSEDGPRPFDPDRQGMMVGEGAGILVLESLEHAQKRGAKVLGLLSGWGHSCDAHHLTAPHPQGTGAKAAMNQALQQAGISSSDICYINAHGTYTLDNDMVEAAAIAEVFGAQVPVSSTKRYTGHALAAAGGIESAISLLSIRDNVVPANLGARTTIDGINVKLENAELLVNHALSNSFGFGGNNAALIFSKAD